MKDKTILDYSNKDKTKNIEFINECAIEVCLNGDDISKYEKIITKAFPDEPELYSKFKLFVDSVEEQKTKKEVSRTSMNNIAFLANEAHINETTLNGILLKLNAPNHPNRKRIWIALFFALAIAVLGYFLFYKASNGGKNENGLTKIVTDSLLENDHDNNTDDSDLLKVIELKIPAPTWEGKVLQGEQEKQFTLKEVSHDEISMEPQEWLSNYKLDSDFLSYVEQPNGEFEGETDVDVRLETFPDTYNGSDLKEYQFYKDYTVAYYAKDYWDYDGLILLDKEGRFMYKLDFSAFSKAPRVKSGDEDYVGQAVRYAHLVGDILYVQHGHRTYAYSSMGQNAYISAINLKKNEILWTTKPLTCNSNFIIVGKTIICGYGFTDEPDYVYLLDSATGNRLQTLRVVTGPDMIVKKGNQIHVLTYDMYYIFDMIERASNPESVDETVYTVDGISYNYSHPTTDQLNAWKQRYHKVCASKIDGQIGNYKVSPEMIDNDPCLVYLILNSESLSEKAEKQNWFDMYSMQTKDQTNRLYDILYRERYKLTQIRSNHD